MRISRTLSATVLALVLVVPTLASCGGSGGSPTASAPGPPSTPPAGPTTAPAAALPDFAIVGYRREPPEGQAVMPGAAVYFHVQVTNKGSAGYGQYIVVQGPGNYTGGFSGLNPGETKEAKIELGVSMPAGGTVSDIYFRVDPDNVTKEADETNNSIGPLTVVYGGG